ncbi:MAG: PAS domain-containing sensor histidine kinase [Anaerolineae bacterium]|nr:PAS domain-containing sensor histidine kinase [Anaerolineae bacterium]MDW8100657.1 PAS domain-containing sensor histidine kinase [Anaerolineae bacterium]
MYRQDRLIANCKRPRALFLLSLAIYAGSFLPLYHLLGPQLIVLSIIPVFVAGRCGGMRGGIAAGLIVFLLHVAFFALITESLRQERALFLEGVLLGSIGIVSVGALIGRFRDLHVRLQWELDELARAQAALQESEERLRESEARFRMITEEALVGVYIIQDGKIRYVNPASARIFGYTPEEIVDRLSPLDLTYPEDRPLVSERLRQRLEGEADVAHYVFRGLRKDGRVIYCEVLGRRLTYQGRPALVGTLLDITERKKAEEALQALNAQLHAALKARDEMIQNVSHELRTPLTLIRGYVEMLQHQAFGPLNEAQQEAIAVLDKQSDRLRYMVDRLLMLQTLDANALRATMLDLGELLKGIVETWKPRGERAGVHLHLDLPADLPLIKADGDLLYHVFHNLLDNAVKFSPAGGEVCIRACREKQRLRITVSDHGIGIPPDKLERVFEQFYQVDGSMTRRFGGMGIGLALCRRIIELHGGHIWAESQGEGQGSVFHIALPYAS